MQNMLTVKSSSTTTYVLENEHVLVDSLQIPFLFHPIGGQRFDHMSKSYACFIKTA